MSDFLKKDSHFVIFILYIIKIKSTLFILIISIQTNILIGSESVFM